VIAALALVFQACEPQARYQILTKLVDGMPSYEEWLHPKPEVRHRPPPVQVFYQQRPAFPKIVEQPKLRAFFLGERPPIEQLESWDEALEALPKFTGPKIKGSVANWDAALEQGIIQPLTSLQKETEGLEPFDGEVRLKSEEKQPVVFRHAPHATWLACENCHNEIFPKEAGATAMTMDELLDGKYCGTCHGKGNVAFDMKLCVLCHPTNEG
jgi:c(7)-type cytochrome triheme protein